MPKKILAVLWMYFISVTAFCQTVDILFVGNSLTYANDLPQLVKLIAKCDNVEVTVRTLAFPNYALEDHINEGRVITELQSRAYDFVIVQQGPSSQNEGRTMLLNDGLKLAKICSDKTKLAFYTVWPAKARSGDFQGVIESYRLAADSTKSILCPAGKAWLKVLKSNPEVTLYSEDNFHPNYSGSLLAALVIYGSINKRANLAFADYNVLKDSNLTRHDFNILLEAAQHTLLQEQKRKK